MFIKLQILYNIYNNRVILKPLKHYNFSLDT